MTATAGHNHPELLTQEKLSLKTQGVSKWEERGIQRPTEKDSKTAI
jgi:hypothetical protein